MAKLKETKKQQEAITVIEEDAKLLKKLADFYEKELAPDITVRTKAAEGSKAQQFVIHLTEDKVKKIILSVAQPAALEMLSLSEKCFIELDDEEQLLADYFKATVATRKKRKSNDGNDEEVSDADDALENEIASDAEAD